MPVNTRRGGPPAGGHQELPEVKRKRTSKKSTKPALEQEAPARLPSPPTPIILSKEMLNTPCPVPTTTTTNPVLTASQAARTPSRKRALDDTSEDEREAKRVNSEKALGYKDPFDRRNYRSNILLTPRRAASLRKSQSARRPTPRPLTDSTAAKIKSLGPKPRAQEQVTATQVESPAVETPTKQGIVGMVTGSITGSIRGIKRIFFGAGTTTEQSPTQDEVNPFESNNLPKASTRANRPYGKVQRPNKPTRSVQATVEDSAEEPDFETVQVTGSNKRKMDNIEASPAKKPRIMLNADENGNITGHWGLTDEMLEISDDEDDVETAQQSTQTTRSEETTQTTQTAQTTDLFSTTTDITGLEHFQPSFVKRRQQLKSALKTGPKPQAKTVHWPNMGPAGIYTGTIFRYDPITPEAPEENVFASKKSNAGHTPRDVSAAEVISPYTDMVTNQNLLTTRWDAVVSGPIQEQYLTPELSPDSAAQNVTYDNPDGCFSVPDDDDASLGSEDAGTATVPNAPKISHAALPGSDDRLNKARQEAQQYKPKQASRLSQVEPARSESSSPPPISAPITTTTLTATSTAEMVQSEQEQPLTAEEVDAARAAIREDAEKMREAEEWAANLDWPEPVSYVDAGLCSEYIDNLIRSRWTEEDDQRTHEFWDKEFDEVNAMCNAAKAEGKTLKLIHEW